jgi:hypothetical protein
MVTLLDFLSLFPVSQIAVLLISCKFLIHFSILLEQDPLDHSILGYTI